MGTSETANTYEARGDVRGGCGHQHRSRETAEACARRDQRACASLGGRAYSDRVARQTGR